MLISLPSISFEGEVVPPGTMTDPEKAKKFDLNAFLFERHPKEKRFPEIEAAAKALKQEHGFKKVGAIGYCWGGWAVFQLGAKGFDPFLLPFLRIARYFDDLS